MKIELRKNGIILFVLTLIIFVSYHASIAGDVVLKAGRTTLAEIKGDKTVIIRGEEFTYKRIKKDKRLKIVSLNSQKGVFLKRYGTRIRLRDLEGNLIHLIIKAGIFYKVKTVMGKELAAIKREPGKVTVSNRDSNSIYHVGPENGKIIFKDENGSTIFSLEGETNPFPAAFLALTPLSLVERVACYLTYR